MTHIREHASSNAEKKGLSSSLDTLERILNLPVKPEKHLITELLEKIYKCFSFNKVKDHKPFNFGTLLKKVHQGIGQENF